MHMARLTRITIILYDGFHYMIRDGTLRWKDYKYLVILVS